MIDASPDWLMIGMWAMLALGSARQALKRVHKGDDPLVMAGLSVAAIAFLVGTLTEFALVAGVIGLVTTAAAVVLLISQRVRRRPT